MIKRPGALRSISPGGPGIVWTPISWDHLGSGVISAPGNGALSRTSGSGWTGSGAWSNTHFTSFPVTLRFNCSGETGGSLSATVGFGDNAANNFSGSFPFAEKWGVGFTSGAVDPITCLTDTLGNGTNVNLSPTYTPGKYLYVRVAANGTVTCCYNSLSNVVFTYPTSATGLTLVPFGSVFDAFNFLGDSAYALI